MKRGKRGVLCLLLAGSLALGGCQKADTQKAFDEFIGREFTDSMAADYVSAHSLMTDPAAFGVEPAEPGWGSRFDAESLEAARQETERTLEEFAKFQKEDLTPAQQETWEIYQWEGQLAQALNGEEFDLYPCLFGSLSGLHYQIPTTLADWEIRAEADIPDLIALIRDTRPYLESALDYTRRQQEAGLLMLDIQQVKSYCDGVIEQGEESGILQSLLEGIDALGLESDRAEGYKQEVREAFREDFLPAYQELSQGLEELTEGQNNQEGLAAFPNGREYYQLLLQNSCGSDKSVEQIRQMMEQSLERHLQNILLLVQARPELYQLWVSGEEPDTGYTDYQSMLADLEEAIQGDFPSVGQLDYEIRPISGEIASDTGVAAYFNIPALDGSEPKQLRVNPNLGEIGSVDTFLTVAHEGFPGHMYQVAWAYQNLDSPYRKVLAGSPAYTEGYATYAQSLAGQYLTELDQDYLTLLWEEQMAGSCLIVLADIGIHYEGWSQQQMGAYFKEMGFALDALSLSLQYRQLQANPCAFQPYYVGYEEIRALRRQAEEELGEDFSQLDFHQALLKSGSAPFFVVEWNVEEYIQSAGQTAGQQPAA